MEDLQARRLTEDQLKRLHRTISSDAFFLIVMHHIITGKGMSAIRLGDFEPMFFGQYASLPDGPIQPFSDRMNEDNYRSLGVHGIDKNELQRRIRLCAKADYLSFSISGYIMQDFDPSPYFAHPRLLDGYFVNNWTAAMIRQLLTRAKGVLLINRDPALGAQLKEKLPGAVQLLMNDWRDAENICAVASQMSQQLVLLSGGCGGKYIALELAKSGKIVLDVGQSAERFTS